MQEEEKKEAAQAEEAAEPAAEPAESEQEAPESREAAPDEPAEAPPEPDEEKEALKRELTMVRAQLAAVQADVEPTAAADAVILAVYGLEQEGKTPDEKSIAAAIGKVLERHPEWKASKAPVAPEKAGAGEPQKEPDGKKPMPAGKVMF